MAQRSILGLYVLVTKRAADKTSIESLEYTKTFFSYRPQRSERGGEAAKSLPKVKKQYENPNN